MSKSIPSIQKPRVFCETGKIDAEVTPSNQWRVPVSEVELLKREGLPPISRLMAVEREAACSWSSPYR